MLIVSGVPDTLYPHLVLDTEDVIKAGSKILSWNSAPVSLDVYYGYKKIQ